MSLLCALAAASGQAEQPEGKLSKLAKPCNLFALQTVEQCLFLPASRCNFTFGANLDGPPPPSVWCRHHRQYIKHAPPLPTHTHSTISQSIAEVPSHFKGAAKLGGAATSNACSVLGSTVFAGRLR